MHLYPILLEPIYKEKVWGGRSLERFGRSLPGDATTLIGESWEVADLASTAPSGGGGDAARSVISNGPLTGRTLGEIVREDPAALLGVVGQGSSAAFPLLVKYLDARQNLSVQVHPSVEYAVRHPEAHLKSEAWYVVDADPGAVIYKGVASGTSRQDFERAIHENTVTDLLVRVAAAPGDCHYLPSGTCHALGGGIVVAEVQTPSDTTFRVYDWGRTDRELHVEAALECIDYRPVRLAGAEPDPQPGSPPNGISTRLLVDCPHFRIVEWRGEAGSERQIDVRSLEVWMMFDGSVDIRDASGRFAPVHASSGRTVVLPASLGPIVVAVGAPSVMLRVSVPEGVVAP